MNLFKKACLVGISVASFQSIAQSYPHYEDIPGTVKTGMNSIVQFLPGDDTSGENSIPENALGYPDGADASGVTSLGLSGSIIGSFKPYVLKGDGTNAAELYVYEWGWFDNFEVYISNVAGRGGLWRWHRRHRTTSFVQIPNKQTFGSFKQITSIYSEIFNPTNFQGVHVGVDPSLINTVTSAVFYDADSGEAFRCGEGAVPSTFLLYGRGYSTTGMNLSVALPVESAYLNTSGIRHGKYIKPENVTVVLFKYPFDSNPWGSVSRGDYYTTYTNCVQQYCFCMWRASSAAGEPTFNTKHINSRAYVNKIVENNFSIKNAVFIGGSIEGFNTPTTVRESAGMSFKGTYFETSDTKNTVMFNVIGWCSLNFENCLIYMDHVTRWVTTGGTSQTAGVTGISVTSHGNTWRKADNASGICFEFDGVVRKSYGLYGDIFHLGGISTLGYYAGAVPTGIYAAPITLTGV